MSVEQNFENRSDFKSNNVETFDGSSMSTSDYLVAFSGHTKNLCVGLVDMVDSTKISASLSVGKITQYYQIFLNTMGKVINRFGGVVIKNIGDSLLYYFPESSSGRKFGFMCTLEAGLAMIDAHDMICLQTKNHNLPCINYRISCDFGPVVIMKSNTDSNLDMIGPPVNISNKINRFADKNEVVIGSDLYETVKKFDEYTFSKKGHYDSGFKLNYPIYSLKRK